MTRTGQASPLHPLTAGLPRLRALAEGADHVDVKTVEGDLTLREFLCGLASWEPGWVRFLYRVRAVFVRLLGMRQEGIPSARVIRPEDVSFTPGDSMMFFTVADAEEDHYFVAGVTESHLTAHLAVVAEPGRFHVATIVKYNRWTGPVYFNVIRPFHHLVVGGMARAAVRGARPS
ncbi:DUF2867 domain-containing protein [Streptosporangium carneum]|uniref:DUF2867 domain-containing protein n=1 Tax=Streptosporangium carneum TaxID=47481 RepID=A0A9W6MA98_9ACTN|nr:DUF2867 domain-containing protein [Streptosporangium carneum]GLK06821.1 hypothetical protein GCM10017600_02260 [Streptosporangium carneum]